MKPKGKRVPEYISIHDAIGLQMSDDRRVCRLVRELVCQEVERAFNALTSKEQEAVLFVLVKGCSYRRGDEMLGIDAKILYERLPGGRKSVGALAKLRRDLSRFNRIGTYLPHHIRPFGIDNIIFDR